jgi:ATP-dependent DNA helicase RecG
MTPSQLFEQLNALLALPAETEWVEFKEAKNDYSFEKLGKYFSALSNEAALAGRSQGWLVFGVNDKHTVVGTHYRNSRPHLDKLKKEVADKTSNRLSFIEIYELNHPHGRVLLFEIPAALPGVPTTWEGHSYGREGESLAPLSLSELDRIRIRSAPDWSAQIVGGADLEDLDPDAIAVARTRFREKNRNERWAKDVAGWSDTVFLNKAKLTINGQITNTALILLGRPESTHFISPAQAQMIWVLKDSHGIEKDYQHFGPPFLLNTDALFQRVRNLTYRYMPDNTLFPTEISQYDAWVMRELLHNCIAHQDYRLNGRINVVEQEDSLLFTNLGHFIPPSVEWVIETDSPPDQYRNPFLAQAMVNLNMIDTMGSGMKRVFRTQRDRFFPLPDYDLSDQQRVKVRLLGKILDENYTRLLMRDSEMGLHEVIALDRVQKGQPLTDDQFRVLKREKLIEGRKPNIYIAASVARATGQQATYIRNRGLDKSHYKELILKYLRTYQQASPVKFEELLLDKMPDVLSFVQKKRKIRNLLQEMARNDQTIQNVGGRGPGALWALRG